MIRRAGAPLLIVAAAATLSALIVVFPPNSDLSEWELLALPVIAFLAGRTQMWPAGAFALGLMLAGLTASQLIEYDDNALVPAYMLPLTLYGAGLALRGREALAAKLERQSRELEIERDAYAGLSVRYERARIAAELHDVVAHAISVMVVQASAGQRLAAEEPLRARETFGVIATAARQAEADLDRLADLLAQDRADDAGADLELVREIVETARASGLPVSLRISGDTSGVPGAVAHAALRVVQEGLTNALRYAPGATAEVAMDARPGALELVIVNGAPASLAPLGLGSGRGLIGLRERVGACGGTVVAGPDGDGGWSVRARIAF